MNKFKAWLINKQGDCMDYRERKYYIAPFENKTNTGGR